MHTTICWNAHHDMQSKDIVFIIKISQEDEKNLLRVKFVKNALHNNYVHLWEKDVQGSRCFTVRP